MAMTFPAMVRKPPKRSRLEVALAPANWLLLPAHINSEIANEN
jgi:hypothetical protein